MRLPSAFALIFAQPTFGVPHFASLHSDRREEPKQKRQFEMHPMKGSESRRCAKSLGRSPRSCADFTVFST